MVGEKSQQRPECQVRSLRALSAMRKLNLCREMISARTEITERDERRAEARFCAPFLAQTCDRFRSGRHIPGLGSRTK